MEAEKKESEFKLLIADKQKQEMMVNQLKLEAEKKQKDFELQEKQVALLKQEKELQAATLKQQALEREKVQRDKEIAQQQLALAQRELEDVKQKEQIAILEKQRQIQDLEKQEQLKAMQLIEAENKLKAQQLEQEKEEKLVNNIITALIVGSLLIILAIIAFAFRQRQKAARRLAAQNAEIERKNTQLEASQQEIQRNLTELQKAYAIIKESEEEIRQKNEELLASEEELRQNMEELQATYEVIETQKNQMEAQNVRITHSIRYAERIQAAILPTRSVRSAVFPEHFLIYKPKDIVSGDFYWVSTEENDVRIAAVIDCTGHGVPGAFMSMIGYTILNDTINTNKITNPAQILSNLNKEVRKRLKQSEGANNDGMDLGICTFEATDDNKIKMTYAGAKHKLFVWTNNKLEELRSDRKMIGGLQTSDDLEFTNTVLVLSKGDIIYLTTDGYIDQANEQRNSVGVAKLRELIKEAAVLPMKEQKDFFEKFLIQHQGAAEQRDDITLLAIKV
jgi:serine phosphatase RsbU (regulator of sigma subunit)